MAPVAAGRGLRWTGLHLSATVRPSKSWNTSRAAAMALNHSFTGTSLRLVSTSTSTSTSTSSTSLAVSPVTQRSIHSSSRTDIQSSERRTSTIAEPLDTMVPMPGGASRAPLSVLPLSMILRSLMTTTVSSSPALLPPSLRIMSMLAHTKNPLLHPDTNPILRFALKHTFYAQFCAGENSPEVRNTIGKLKNIGFTGVILGYAREVVLSESESKQLGADKPGLETEDGIRNEIDPWAMGTLETVRLAEPGDFVALKFTGAGRAALHQLKNRTESSPHLYRRIDEICNLAAQREVRLLFDAEQDSLQDGIDDWTMHFAKKYNTQNATIFGTYQAYKKNMPEVIASHLAMAREGGFQLGVKLVRGAYLGSDPRHRLHDTKEATDDCYNGIAASVLTRQWTDVVKGDGIYPSASIVLATHNAESVRRARAICDAGVAKSPVAFAQLQGMADEVSCELVEASLQPSRTSASNLPTFKYLVWGTTGECMKYLLRRAYENKDAVQRTRDGRDAMWGELVRRCKAVVGLANSA
ncbi:hypothetical protein N3K66_005324 [Trichothecium roseum]|uniref:Uncharacterized protein n=1 Tax=Trichothecium roseum TaxID=47278 RepID=A0ACC0UYW1_9HYPO|nr:hypothetical protein N3K66_005324 [Trichothecium roseum]